MADCPVVKEIKILPNTVDLAIVAVSALKVLPLLKPLAAKGVHHLIIISGGFSETGGNRRKSATSSSGRSATLGHPYHRS